MNQTIPQVDVHAVKKRIDAGEDFLLLDVRQQDEYDFARLPNSRLFPLPELHTKIDEIKKEADGRSIVAYCHHGRRSMNAASILMQNGIENVASMTGGIDAWSVEVDPSVPRY